MGTKDGQRGRKGRREAAGGAGPLLPTNLCLATRCLGRPHQRLDVGVNREEKSKVQTGIRDCKNVIITNEQAPL